MYYTCLLKQVLYTEVVAEGSKRRYIFIVSTKLTVSWARYHRRSYLYSTEIATYSDRWLPSVTSDDSTSKLFDFALCFWLRWLVQVVFFRSNYHYFFFFRLNYHSDFYSSLKLLYIHQMIENHLIDDWNFLYLFICLFVHICICHYSHCTRIYQSLSLFTIVFHVSTHLYSLCS